MNFKLKTSGGDSFDNVSKRALELAIAKNITVEFDFNSILCIVNMRTYLDGLYRDYCNAYIMEWKEVGPNCKISYDADTEIELHTRKLAAAKKRKDEEIAYDQKIKIEKAAFDEKVAGVQMEFKDENAWIEGKMKNTDPYGACVYEYAEGWAKLMQVEINKGNKLIDCAEQTSYQLGFLGITGFMYGAAVSVLSHCWKYGEDLRKWHNKEYNHEGNGVINPAILSIKSKN
jgi:hypothetical protein